MTYLVQLGFPSIVADNQPVACHTQQTEYDAQDHVCYRGVLEITILKSHCGAKKKCVTAIEKKEEKFTCHSNIYDLYKCDGRRELLASLDDAVLGVT